MELLVIVRLHLTEEGCVRSKVSSEQQAPETALQFLEKKCYRPSQQVGPEAARGQLGWLLPYLLPV
jgi:hypothetical protein